MALTVPQRLAALGELYKARNKLYGNDYLKFGAALSAMFPEGITLKGEDQFGRMALFFNCFQKLSRYASSMPNGQQLDSLSDLSVYAQMLSQFDEVKKCE